MVKDGGKNRLQSVSWWRSQHSEEKACHIKTGFLSGLGLLSNGLDVG